MVQLMRRRKFGEAGVGAAAPAPEAKTRAIESVAIPAGDPLESLLLFSGQPVSLHGLELESAVLSTLRSHGVELIVPLVGRGELLGALYLGARLSDQPYSTDDRRLLRNLASQVAPAVKVAQLVLEQQAEAKERERFEQELKVAALIQQTLLPKSVPASVGWDVGAFYRPARAVGGDFYDFVAFDDTRLGVLIGDVTDKGVPAALVMATCRAMLRSVSQQHSSPSAILAEVNDALVEEIPSGMFVTCLYAIIDTEMGEVVYANAGHNLPYVRTGVEVLELRATGMPLGLMPGMAYEEKRYTMAAGQVLVLTSDGITEAHNPQGEMYGFPRLMRTVAGCAADADMITVVVDDLEAFTGEGSEQEDDITLVVVRRTASAADSAAAFEDTPQVLTSFTIPSEEGNERQAIEKVAAAVAPLGVDPARVERLKTAVGETVMNAIEHGNAYRSDLAVGVEVNVSNRSISVRVTDQGVSGVVDRGEHPDLEAKLAGHQTPRGWGLFLTEQMVDEVTFSSDSGTHTVELTIHREGVI
jgi:serine phosphatase RsbU (regulator of sigma subunit)/anti-sigma regulatory factor (Ser/Thr protein kinase)